MKGSDHSMPTGNDYRWRAVPAHRSHRLLPHPGMTPALSVDRRRSNDCAWGAKRRRSPAPRALTDLDSAVASYRAINAGTRELTFRVGRLRSQIDLYEERTRDLRQVIRDRAVNSTCMATSGGRSHRSLTPRLRINQSSPRICTGPRRRHRFLVTPDTPGGDDE